MIHTKWLWDIMPCELRLDDPKGTVLFRCVHTHEPTEDVKRLIAAAPELLDIVRDYVNFLADLNTTSPSERSKALHKRAYTAHSKAKSHADTLKGE